MSESNKEYSNGEITVVWKPEICIHSGKCVQGLPNVFRPKDKPWIQLGGTSSSDLKNQVEKCPSGALSYYFNAGSTDSENSKEVTSTRIEVVPNGPLIVHGKLEVKLADGSNESKPTRASFCRCGHSANKPFCDGMHKKIEFKG